MPTKKLTLADVELVARSSAPEWWDSLTEEERLAVVDQYNEEQSAADLLARTFNGPAKRARS